MWRESVTARVEHSYGGHNVNSDPGFSGIPEGSHFSTGAQIQSGETTRAIRCTVQQNVTFINAATHHKAESLSSWSRSGAKRAFDLACVLGTLPISVPLFVVIGLAVRLSSRGPVLFRQERMGRYGKKFTILKFRTMPVHDSSTDRPAVTTNENQEFTPIGPFLRRFKFDELPQLINVLCGEMSLVGPRPKMPQHQSFHLHSRPGITGHATVLFAQEEDALSRIPVEDLDAYYHSVILPLKQRLDVEYMAKATFASDFMLLVDSVLRNWRNWELMQLLSESPQRGWQPASEGASEGYAAPSVLAAQSVAMSARRQND